LSSCALAQYSFTRTKNFSSRARPASSSTRTRTQSSAGSYIRPANAGTRNPRGLTRPAQDSSVDAVDEIAASTSLVLTKSKSHNEISHVYIQKKA